MKHGSAREVARDALVRIDSDDAYANLVLPPLLDRSALDARDRRFVTELVYGTTRMRRAVDAALAPFVQRAVEPSVRAVLRLGAYQLHYAGVAPHAAVSATVSAAPRRAQGFVNAVLRRVAEAGAPELHDVGERLSYPDWIVERLRADLGDDDAFGALEAMNTAPRPHERDDGYVQDPASGWVAGLVDAEPGHRVADVCAAPGGKATALAHLVGGEGLVVAGDIRPNRAALIAQNAASTGTAEVVTPLVADATRPPLRRSAFDSVLVDAPCSGLGVLHRRADARWRVQPEDVTALAATSKALLVTSAELVASGGLLVFAVCTITSVETSDVAGWAVRELPEFSPLPAPGGPWRPHGHGALLLPQVAGTDGMFVLRLRRS
ncbi:MAG TPA: transcription antitermination factor NusB [Acidimicrobiales bacterium]|nr:transcription antitermination factor NusB [Acidimicrobiales bacterium]